MRGNVNAFSRSTTATRNWATECKCCARKCEKKPEIKCKVKLYNEKRHHERAPIFPRRLGADQKLRAVETTLSFYVAQRLITLIYFKALLIPTVLRALRSSREAWR